MRLSCLPACLPVPLNSPTAAAASFQTRNSARFFSGAGPCSLKPVFLSLVILMTAVLMAPPKARAQEGQLDKSLPQGISVDEIIKRFSAKEKEFKEARDQYTYRQHEKVMT